MSNFNSYSDNDLRDLFSDWYKSVTNIRPGANWSRDQIISWMEHESQPEVQAARQAKWAAEEEWLAQYEARMLEEEQRRAAEKEERRLDEVEAMYYNMELALA